jgi:hypothetical protein
MRYLQWRTIKLVRKSRQSPVIRAPLRLYERRESSWVFQYKIWIHYQLKSKECLGYNEVSVSSAYKAFARCLNKQEPSKYNIKEQDRRPICVLSKTYTKIYILILHTWKSWQSCSPLYWQERVEQQFGPKVDIVQCLSFTDTSRTINFIA